MRDSSRFPCHHRVWLGPVLGWPWLVTEHCSQWSGYCSSDRGGGDSWWRGDRWQPGELSAGEPRPCQGRAWCQCFARLVTARLTSQTQTHWSHVICRGWPPVHAPDERLSRVNNEQYKRRKSGFLCHTSSLLSLWSAEWRAGPGPDNPSHEEIIDRRELTVCPVPG